MPMLVVAISVGVLLLAAISPKAQADDIDSLINLDRAFRDEILGQSAPQAYQGLIRDGETTITFVDDFGDTVGKTDFFLLFEWAYDYRYTTKAEGDSQLVEVTAMNVRLKSRVRHVIRLPNAHFHAEVWRSRLLGHEFDHVAVSLDPRPRIILLELCRKLPKYRFSIKASEKPAETQMRNGIDREIQRRQDSVLDLIRANYVLLDKETTHGRVSMKDRNAFFNALYTRDNLTASRFAFTNEVGEFLSSEAYNHLRPRHVSVDPATLEVR